MICSNVIVSLGGIRLITAPLRPILGKLFCLSENGCYVFLSGLLCGYPMGAKTCSEFVSQGKLSPSEGRYLLSISNHPSPMFLLGYTASLMDPAIPPALLLTSIYLPVIAVAFLSRSLYRVHVSSRFMVQKTQPCHSFDESMMDSFEVMVKIGGYIMLFSILARFIGQLAFLSPQNPGPAPWRGGDHHRHTGCDPHLFWAFPGAAPVFYRGLWRHLRPVPD